jgi:hypothetical protein
MSRREKRKVELALAILRRSFAGDRFKHPDRGPALQLALRVLLPHTGRHVLITFWNASDNPNTLQRINNLKKVYAVIEGLAAKHE